MAQTEKEQYILVQRYLPINSEAKHSVDSSKIVEYNRKTIIKLCQQLSTAPICCLAVSSLTLKNSKLVWGCDPNVESVQVLTCGADLRLACEAVRCSVPHVGQCYQCSLIPQKYILSADHSGSLQKHMSQNSCAELP